MNAREAGKRLLNRYRQIPENGRLIGTALMGLVLGFITYEVLYTLNPFEPRASVSWFAAYMIAVVRQHALHRWLTFTYRPPYWASLRRAYVMDTASCVVTTVLNWMMTEVWTVDHRLAWFLCLLTTALINAVLLKFYVFRSPKTDRYACRPNL